jgi:predicted nucleotidyltransferase
LFIFGSALYSENPRDIDILVVYATTLRPGDALYFRAKLIRKLKKYITIPIHIVLLSRDEEREVRFIKTENCRLLRRQDIRRWHSAGRK